VPTRILTAMALCALLAVSASTAAHAAQSDLIKLRMQPPSSDLTDMKKQPQSSDLTRMKKPQSSEQPKTRREQLEEAANKINTHNKQTEERIDAARGKDKALLNALDTQRRVDYPIKTKGKCPPFDPRCR
jgi:hypothetical protein